MKPEGLL